MCSARKKQLSAGGKLGCCIARDACAAPVFNAAAAVNGGNPNQPNEPNGSVHA
jgi:hypothetical protein